MEKYQKKIDLFLKIIPILVFFFLICNFIFNAGYFFPIGLKFISLLEMKDYYEGTAPLVTFSLLLFFFSFINIMLNADVIKKMLSLCCEFCSILRDLIPVLFKHNFYFISYKKMPYNIKKILAKEKATIKRILSKITTIVKQNFSFIILTLFFIIGPYFTFYFHTIEYSKFVFYLLCILYFLLTLIFMTFKSNFLKYTLAVIIISLLIFTLGYWAFLRDFKASGTKVLMENGQEHLMLRAITKGVIIKTENNLSFYFWDKVNCVVKNINNTKGEVDAK